MPTYPTIALLLGALAATAVPIGQAPSHTGSMLAHSAPSVVRVESRSCTTSGMGSSERTATGFVWRDKDTIVTALHVVIGCGNIGVVYSRPTNIARPATIVKVSRDADLALLSVTGAPAVAPLGVAAQAPSIDSKLEVLGFPLHIPTMNSTTLSLRFGGSKLQDIVPLNVKQSLQQNGFPNVALDITNIEGHLLPGLSGAPILNSTGEVVAVGDGGLENGTVGISWGIPANELPKLAASTDTNGGGSTNGHIGNLFAAETEASNMGSVTCSGYTLTKVRTVAYPQIAATTDDPLGLQQLVNYFGIDPTAFRFDIYQQLDSGATVALPAGVTLHPQGDGCDASVHGGDFTLHASFATLSDPQEVQAKSMQMEQAAAGGAQGWMADPQFTTMMPVTRFDGLGVRRRAWTHAPYPGMPQDKYFFETIAVRGTVLINASVLNNIANPQNQQRAMVCRMNAALPGCNLENKRTDDWVKSVIAVHLSTFPVG